MATAELKSGQTTDGPAPEREGSKFEYSGIPTTCDGAEAVVWVETHVSQGSGAYPITSSTTMGSGFNLAVMNGKPNLWGEQLVFVEPENGGTRITQVTEAGPGDSFRLPNPGTTHPEGSVRTSRQPSR